VGNQTRVHRHGQPIKTETQCPSEKGLNNEVKMKKTKMSKHMRLLKRARDKGFTLVELLVVIAIIAVIGAGVAVTYQNLDDQAKTAMEISDMAILKKITKHWSAVNDYALPDEMDSLVDDEGNLYTSFSIGGTPSSSGMGLYGPIGYGTLEVHEAPSEVLTNLATAGMEFTYIHRVDATNANDSTFEAGMFGDAVDTTNTKSTLIAGGSGAATDAAEVVADGGGAAHDYDGPDDIEGNADDVDYSFTAPTNGTSFGPYATLADWTAAQTAQQDILDTNPTDKLAFVYPGSGFAGASFTDEIITNAGLKPEQVANPATGPVAAEKYYLVVMGYGRFASIYRGKAIRSDAPSYGKRQAQSDTDYNRYLAVIKVPVTTGGFGSAPVEPATLVDVLSPQGYSVAALRDNFIDDQDKIQDDT